MLKRFAAAALVAVAIAACAPAAQAREGDRPPASPMCEKCRGMMFIMTVGKCSKCGGPTSSGAHKYCRACAIRLGKCQACGKDLKGRPSAGPPPEVIRGSDLIIDGTVTKVFDRRPARMYPNYYLVVAVTKVKKAPAGMRRPRQVRLIGPAAQLDKLRADYEATFYLGAVRNAPGDYNVLFVRLSEKTMKNPPRHGPPPPGEGGGGGPGGGGPPPGEGPP